MKYLVIILAFALLLPPLASAQDEQCTITLKDGVIVKEDKPQKLSCELIQQSWENMTSVEYAAANKKTVTSLSNQENQEYVDRINEAGQKLGQMFSDDRSTLDFLKDIEEKLEELNKQ